MMNANISGDVKDFISIDANTIDHCLKTGRASILRWALWISLHGSRRPGGWVLASPEVVGRDMLGRPVVRDAVAGVEVRRPGVSAVTLQRQRARLLSCGVQVKSGGLYRLPCGPRWHRIDRAALEWLIYSCPSPSLRAMVSLWVPLSVAASSSRPHAHAPARRLARAARMSPSRWCRAVRDLRIGDAIEDNRPGRVWDRQNRRPVRIVRVVSWAAPVPGARFARGSDQTGPINRDTKPEANTPKGRDLSSGTSPTELWSSSTLTPPASEPCEIEPTEQPATAPSASGDAPERAERAARRTTRAQIVEAGRRDAGIAIGARSAAALARLFPDIRDFRWFLEAAARSEGLNRSEHPGAWLAHVGAAEVRAILARTWAPRASKTGGSPSGWGATDTEQPSEGRREAHARAAETAIGRAETASGEEREILLSRARRLAERAGGARGAAVLARVEAAERPARVRDRDLVGELIERAGEAARATGRAFGPSNPLAGWEPSRARRRGGVLVLEVGEVSIGEVLSDYGAELAAAWRSMGGGALAVTHPGSARSWRLS